MEKKIGVIIGARGIGDLIYHLPLLRSLHKSYKNKLIIFSNIVNKSPEVFKDEFFFKKIINFDNYRYGPLKTIINIIKFKKLLNKYCFDRIILTSNARRLILPVILSNAIKKDIFGNGNFIFNKDRSLDKYTISERLLKYTNQLNLPKKVNNFFLNSKKNNSKKKNKIFISVDSFHDQNNWPIENYIEIIKKIKKKNIIYINFSPKKKYFLKYFAKNKIDSKNIIFTYDKKISKIIEIIKDCRVIIGNESGPVCLGSSLKKSVHAIYMPIHTKPESKIIYKKNKYYNTSKLKDSEIVKKIINSI